MQKEFPKHAVVLVASLLLCIVALLAVRYFTKPEKKTEVQSSVPAFTSAKFEGADILRGLGPEWTYVRLTELAKSDGNWLSGTVPVREAVVKLVGKEVSMMLVELKIENQTKLKAALQNPNVKTAKVAERDGYLIPMNDIAGGTAFMLLGDEKVLLIQYGKAAEWPDQVEPEIMSFIVNLNI